MSSNERIRAELLRAARELGAPEDTAPAVERPRDTMHGDWTSNIAMMLARPLKKKPGDIAKALKESVNLDSAGVEAIEIAGPGFLNFRLNKGVNASSNIAV